MKVEPFGVEVSRGSEQAEHLESRKRALDTAEDWWRRWVFSLTVGNGAGLLAVGAALLKPESGAALAPDLLIRSGWLFLGGVLAAGLIARLRSSAHYLIAEYDLAVALGPPSDDVDKQIHGQVWRNKVFGDPYPEVDDRADRTVRPREVLMFICRVLELGSALAFAAGLALPLATLSGL